LGTKFRARGSSICILFLANQKAAAIYVANEKAGFCSFLIAKFASKLEDLNYFIIAFAGIYLV
jgi:hypothetical protein